MTTAMMSGHCLFPANERVVDGQVVAAPKMHSHETCAEHGAGATSPNLGFMPCPCWCHLGTDEYECANCGGPLREAPLWPNTDEPGEMVYVHIDSTGRAIGEECS